MGWGCQVWGVGMRWISLLLFFATLFFGAIASSSSSRAEIYYIDLNNTSHASVPGTGGYNDGPCYCVGDPGITTPFYLFHAGDIVDFGTVTVSPMIAGGPPSNVPEPYYVTVTGLPAVNFTSPYNFQFPFYTSAYCANGSPVCGETETVSLIFTIPQGDTGVQIAWGGNYSYEAPNALVDPVPEPSTWAMLLIGFVGIGFAASLKTKSSRGWPHCHSNTPRATSAVPVHVTVVVPVPVVGTGVKLPTRSFTDPKVWSVV